MDYGNLLRRSWNILNENRFMFVLGLLAALSGASGGSNANFNLDSSGDATFNGVEIGPEVAANLERFWAAYAGIAIVGILFFFVLSIILWLLSLVGQAGLISSVSAADSGEKVSLSTAFSAGVDKLGKMVGLNLLLFGPFLILFIIFIVIFLATFGTIIAASATGVEPNMDVVGGSIGLAFACVGILFCLLVPVILILQIVYPFATRGLVLYEYGIVESVRRGWQVIRNNLGEVVVLIIIFAVIGFLFNLLAAAILVPIGALIFLPTILTIINGGAVAAGNIIMLVIGGILLAILAAIINAVLITYRSATVTLAYEEFVGKSGEVALV